MNQANKSNKIERRIDSNEKTPGGCLERAVKGFIASIQDYLMPRARTCTSCWPIEIQSGRNFVADLSPLPHQTEANLSRLAHRSGLTTLRAGCERPLS
jgi:hypothetical protein